MSETAKLRPGLIKPPPPKPPEGEMSDSRKRAIAVRLGLITSLPIVALALLFSGGPKFLGIPLEISSKPFGLHSMLPWWILIVGFPLFMIQVIHAALKSSDKEVASVLLAAVFGLCFGFAVFAGGTFSENFLLWIGSGTFMAALLFGNASAFSFAVAAVTPVTVFYSGILWWFGGLDFALAFWVFIGFLSSAAIMAAIASLIAAPIRMIPAGKGLASIGDWISASDKR